MFEFSLSPYICNGKVDIDLADDDGFNSQKSVLHLVKHSSRAHMEIRPTNLKEIERSLRTLAAFSRFMASSSIKWCLSGGVALDLIKGTSFREHGDLDVVLPIDQAPKLKEFLADNGISAYRRVCTATYHADDRATIFRRTAPSLKDFGHLRTLKLFMGPKDRVLPFVDIHFVSPFLNGLALLCEKQIIKLPFPLKGEHAFNIGDNQISCCDLRLMLYMKSNTNPRNFHDAERIAQELSQPEVNQVLRLRRLNDERARSMGWRRLKQISSNSALAFNDWTVN